MFTFYILATSKVISRQVLTCDCAHSWQLCSATQLGNQAISTMTYYPTRLHCPGTKRTSPWSVPLMLSTRLGINMYHFYKSSIWLALIPCALPIWPPHPSFNGVRYYPMHQFLGLKLSIHICVRARAHVHSRVALALAFSPLCIHCRARAHAHAHARII